jgi:hypothetical protein
MRSCLGDFSTRSERELFCERPPLLRPSFAQTFAVKGAISKTDVATTKAVFDNIVAIKHLLCFCVLSI